LIGGILTDAYRANAEEAEAAFREATGEEFPEGLK
jgi:hypothetical protein